MTRAERLLAALLVLVVPFGEGGRLPTALLIAHALSLAFVCAVAARAGNGLLQPALDRRVTAFLAVALAAVSLSAILAPYRLAALLGGIDLAVPAALFFAVVAARPRPSDAFFVRDVVAASSALQAAIAVMRFGGGGGPAAGGAFLNPNHLAAFLVAGVLIAAAAVEESLRAAPKRVVIWTAVATLHVAALILLASRGALAALCAALALFAALRWRTWTRAGRAAVVVAGVTVVLLAGWGVAARFGRTEDPYRYHRLRIWRAAAAMIADHPLVGSGPGMFRHEAPRHNFPSDVGPLRFERRFQGAHSGWLTLAAETGVPAALVCAAAVALLGAGLLARAGGSGGGVRCGAGLALAALAIHACVEDLQERPALLIVPALLVGAATAATGRRAAAPGGAAAGRRLTPGRALAGTAAAYVLLTAILLPWLADRTAARARSRGPAGLGEMRLAARLNPLHPEYRHDLAMAALNSGSPSPELYAEAAAHLEEARRLNPLDFRFPLLLARLEALAGTRLFEDATASERAVGLYEKAARLAPFDPRPLLELAHHLAEAGRPEPALAAARRALALEPRYVRARVFEASLLVRLGRRDEARAARAAALGALEDLSRFAPESGYAREIARDVPLARARLDADLTGDAPARNPRRAPGHEGAKR